MPQTPEYVPELFPQEALQPMREYGERILQCSLWDICHIDNMMVTGLNIADYLREAPDISQLRFERTGNILDDMFTILTREFDVPHELSVGFNYYFQSGEYGQQPVHIDRRMAHVVTLAGAGGVRLFERNLDDNNQPIPIAEISCSPGDYFSAGDARHAGFGDGSRVQPRISMYWY